MGVGIRRGGEAITLFGGVMETNGEAKGERKWNMRIFGILGDA